MISIRFQGKPFNITVFQVMPQPLCWRSWSGTILCRPLRPPRTNTKKKIFFFILADWNAKVRSQDTPGVTGKFSLGVQNEARQSLTEFCQENTLVIANTLLQQHKRRLYTWTSPNGQYWYQVDYILGIWRWRSSIPSAKKQDLELTVVQIINSLLQNSGSNWRQWTLVHSGMT